MYGNFGVKIRITEISKKDLKFAFDLVNFLCSLGSGPFLYLSLPYMFYEFLLKQIHMGGTTVLLLKCFKIFGRKWEGWRIRFL